MNDPVRDGDSIHLPVDADSDVDLPRARGAVAVHLRASSLALVFVGGTFGTAAREALSLGFPSIGGIPYAIFGINVAGAFLLGVLLEALARRGADHGRRRHLRLLLGTGVMGGFTTYSALAVDTAALLGTGAAGSGIAYAIGTVLVGAAATWAGIALGAATHRPARKGS